MNNQHTEESMFLPVPEESMHDFVIAAFKKILDQFSPRYKFTASHLHEIFKDLSFCQLIEVIHRLKKKGLLSLTAERTTFQYGRFAKFYYKIPSNYKKFLI